MAGSAEGEVVLSPFCSEAELPEVIALMEMDLSEPYTVFTYRYFIRNWPHLCILARCDGKLVGAVIARESPVARTVDNIGYIAMLAVDKSQRRKGIGQRLVERVIDVMLQRCHAVELEAEHVNRGAIRLYERLGFVRTHRMCRYYLNGSDAFKLKKVFRPLKFAEDEEEPAKTEAGDKASTAAGPTPVEV